MYKEETMNIRLKGKLMERGLSQVSLCFQIGLREERLSRIIRGWHTPTKEEKIRIANGLGCKVEDVF